MSKKKHEWTRKGVTASMAVVLAFGMTPAAMAIAEEAPTDAPAYSDVDGHWAESAIDRWSEYGIVRGSDGLFSPDKDMTRAEAAVAYANLLGLETEADLSGFSDVDSSAWYAEGLAKCVAAGILQGDGAGSLSPNETITREQMFLVLARILGVTPENSSNVEFSDADQVSDWAQGAINALVNRGVISGMGDGTLAPGEDIDRASVMMMLDMAIDQYVVNDGASVEANGGTVLVVADNATVSGTADAVVVAGSGNSASVSAQVSEATVLGPKTKLTFAEGAKVGSVSVPASAEGASVVVSSGAEVTSLDSAAKGVSVSGEGTLTSAEVSGEDTNVDTEGTKLTVTEGTSGVTENGKPVAGGETVETAPEETPAPPAHIHNYSVTEVMAADNPGVVAAHTYTCTSGDDSYTLPAENAQAVVNGRYYLDLTKAIEGVKAGESIVLCKDVSVAVDSTLQIGSSVPVAIDLGSHTLSVSITGEQDCIRVADGAKLSFSNGSLNVTADTIGISVGTGGDIGQKVCPT